MFNKAPNPLPKTSFEHKMCNNKNKGAKSALDFYYREIIPIRSSTTTSNTLS